MNKAILVGRLGKDPETRYTSSGKAVVNFSMATDFSYKDRNGEKVKQTEWHKLVAWDKLAEIIQQYCVKGQLIYIEGRLQTRKWEKDGTTHYSTEIVVETMKMLGGGKDRGESSDRNEAPAGQSTGGRAQGHTPSPEISDEDIPF